MADEEEEYDEIGSAIDHFLLHAKANLHELKTVNNVNSLHQFIFSARSSYRKHTEDDVEILGKMLPELKGMVKELVEELDDIRDEIENPEEDEMPQQDVVRHKRSLRHRLKTFKQIAENLLEVRSGKRDISSFAHLIQTEKEPLSQFPPGIPENITSYLSGTEGSIDAQMNEVRRQFGKPPLPPKKEGGRKTKKNRSRRKKTHGRRV